METRTRGYETALLAAVAVAAVATLAGTVLVSLQDAYYEPGIYVWTLAAVLVAGSVLLSFPVGSLHVVGRATTGGHRYEQLRRWNRVKVSSVLLNLLLVLGVLVLVTALLSRFDVVSVSLETIGVHRALGLLIVGIGITAAYAHYEALRMDLKPDRSGSTRMVSMGGLQMAVVFAAFAAYLASRDTPLEVGLSLRPGDGIIMMLAAHLLLGVVVMVSRNLPTLYVIVSDERSAYMGRDYVSRQKSVVMPTLVAFTLLFVFLLLMVVFGAGAVSVVQQISSNRVVLLLLVLIVLAVVGGLGMSLVIARQEDRIVLYRRRTTKEQQQELIVLAVSGVMTAFFLLSAIALFRDLNVFGLPRDRWLDFAAFGLMAAVGPYGFHAAHRHKRIQQMEQRFPDFLRDLASSHKGGLTLVQAVHVAARGEYGALTPEVQKMADQLSWNVGFEEALQRFGVRVNTPLVQRSISLVLEAGRSGGSTTDILMAAARDAREIKTLEKQRRLSMSVYTTVIYVTFFVFLFVIGVLFARFVPQILEAGRATADSSIGEVQGLGGLLGVSLDEYRTFYFLAAAVQALGNGIMAGLMGTGKTVLGLKHAFIMVFVTYIAFAFVMN